MYATKRTNNLERDFNASSVDMNIISEHFLNYIEHYEAGKDIRLYSMGDFLGDSYITLERDYYERALKNSYKKAAWTLPVTILNTVLIWDLRCSYLCSSERRYHGRFDCEVCDLYHAACRNFDQYCHNNPTSSV